MSKSPRSLASRRASIAAVALHSQRDSRELTAAARAAFEARWEREVDPGGVLAPAERARRAALAKRLYFQRLAYQRAKSRG